MKIEKDLTCIVCPVGCVMHIKKDGDNIEVIGNSCKRGYTYAVDELTDPKRMVTSSIAVTGGDMPLVSVKTRQAVPKNMIDEILIEIKKARTQFPVHIGDVLISNVCGTGVDIIATRNT